MMDMRGTDVGRNPQSGAALPVNVIPNPVASHPSGEYFQVYELRINNLKSCILVANHKIIFKVFT